MEGPSNTMTSKLSDDAVTMLSGVSFNNPPYLVEPLTRSNDIDPLQQTFPGKPEGALRS